jgi:hypothetical protein
MPSHEEFLELGALAAIGQITAAEHALLAAHLRNCIDCREAFAEYSTILRHDLPQANPSQLRTSDSSLLRRTDAELRERFLSRVRAAGIEFSPEVDRPVFPERAVLRRLRAPAIYAGVAASVLLIAGLVGYFAMRPPRSAPVVAAARTALMPPHAAAVAVVQQRKPIADSRAELAALSKERAELIQQLGSKTADLEFSKHNAEQLGLEIARLRSHNGELETSRHRDESQLADLQTQIQSIQNSNATSVATIVELQDRIRSLKASLDQQSERSDIDRQMASVSSDVRQLMGARNLHIVDVHDVNGEGKSAQSFGRVFYAEGQSLIFYAFDLPAVKPTHAKYYFKAWGQQEARTKSVHNLGTFTIDDSEQQRWVLKINDPALLKGIDSVFVTAETVGDRKQPEGKRLLYAYLAGTANHP